MLYDIYNPHPSQPRVIYDGLVSPELMATKVVDVDEDGRTIMRPYTPKAQDMKTIAIPPREMVKGVALADVIVERMKRAAAKAGHPGFHTELQIREHVEEELGDPPASTPPKWPDAA